MKNKIMSVILAITLCSISLCTFAATEHQLFNITIPSKKQTYTSDYYTKNYYSEQKYWNNAMNSNYDGTTTHNLQVKIVGANVTEPSFSSLGNNSTITFSDEQYKKTGRYAIVFRNSTYSLYTYYHSGIWYYSV